LSIGYSACHWCHVMAHESFEDPATATLMNELFINIKVDREERPDLDRIYQVAQQMLTHGSGGWPLTMFLSPKQQEPFFGGTYFPKDARFGLPAFGDLLRRVAEYYRGQSAQIEAQSAQLQAALASLVHGAAPSASFSMRHPCPGTCRARAILRRRFGGFTARRSSRIQQHRALYARLVRAHRATPIPICRRLHGEASR